jgi:hypothetical protein
MLLVEDRSRDHILRIASRPDKPDFDSGKRQDIFLLQNAQTGSETHPASKQWALVSLFPKI